MASVELALHRIRAGVNNAPDGIRTVITDQHRSILSHRDPHRSSPDVPIVDHESGQEILVLAAGMTGLVQGHAYHFISGAH